jgi:sugar lactone lactonase YvrE
MRRTARAVAVMMMGTVAFSASAGDRDPVVELRGLKAPRAVAADPQSSPFVAAADGRVLHLLEQRVSVPLANTGGEPGGMAFDGDANIFVADAKRHAVLKITPWGETSVFADRCGTKPFATPARVAMAVDGTLYATDTAAGAIYRIDAEGRASVFASGVAGANGIAATADGKWVFVADGERRVWKIAADGARRSVFATLPGESSAAGMSLDERGNLYAALDGDGAVVVLGPDGKLVDRYAIPGRKVTDVAFGGPDLKHLYITASDTGSVYVLRAPYRAQRLPWEPDPRFHITSPVDGAILNRHDGETTAAGLRITVSGVSQAAGEVRINGASVPVRDGAFQTALVLRDRETPIVAGNAAGLRAQATVLWDRESFKRYRISTDDNILLFKDIAQHAAEYRSIFDNAYLAFWRDMHTRYGAKIHFNIYYETAGFNLSQMPDRFRDEWRENAGWIRLSFHARANDPDRPYLHAAPEKVLADYRLVVKEIARFAGPELLSPVTTVHWGTATRGAMRLLRKEGIRTAVGYFEPHGDTPLVSYYLPLAQWQYLGGRDYWKDTREDILFVHHDSVMNLYSPDEGVARLEEIAADPHRGEILELMIHEQYFHRDYVHFEPDYRERVERAIAWVTEHGYKPVFYSDGFLGNPAGALNSR